MRTHAAACSWPRTPSSYTMPWTVQQLQKTPPRTLSNLLDKEWILDLIYQSSTRSSASVWHLVFADLPQRGCWKPIMFPVNPKTPSVKNDGVDKILERSRFIKRISHDSKQALAYWKILFHRGNWCLDWLKINCLVCKSKWQCWVRTVKNSRRVWWGRKFA